MQSCGVRAPYFTVFPTSPAARHPGHYFFYQYLESCLSFLQLHEFHGSDVPFAYLIDALLIFKIFKLFPAFCYNHKAVTPVFMQTSSAHYEHVQNKLLEVESVQQR